MEFLNLNPMNGQDGKPMWQACDNIAVISCVPSSKAYQTQASTRYYHSVNVMSVSGQSMTCQFVNGNPQGVIPGDYAVKVQVKIYNGNKTYTFKQATAQQAQGGNQQTYQPTTPQQSRPANDPETTNRIIRSNAANACGGCCNDPATFWSMLPLVQRYIETGEMPSE